MTATKNAVAALLEHQGETYAAQAGIRLRDTPAPLYQLLVLSTLLSARISADIAVSAAHQLFISGYRTPQAMRDATWQERVDALGRGHYRRYDEKTSTMLAQGAELVLDKWKGDLRRLHREGGDSQGIARLLQEVPGIGPTGASIFNREVQAVWTDLAPLVDKTTATGAQKLNLPTDGSRLARLVDSADFPRLVAGCVRVALSKKCAEEVRRAS